MSNSALASLTEQYTDSENEDDHHAVGSSDSSNSQASQVIIPKCATPIQTPDTPPRKLKTVSSKRQKKALRLVSYQDDTIISDDEDSVEETGSESESCSDDDEAAPASTSVHSVKEHATAMDVDAETENAGAAGSENHSKTPTHSSKIEKSAKYAHYGFSLPPEPKGKPPAELLEKIRHLYEKMGTTNMDMNRIIQERKEFRNPSIYEKLIQFCDINEFGTNYPPEVYDPLQWGPESYYEELARVQKNEMLKRQKERKENDKIEQATALARKVEEEAKKRKSKWDQPAPVKSVSTALTTTVTGTKGTVISAFGSLPKKPVA